MLKTLSIGLLGAALAAFVAQAQVRFVQLELSATNFVARYQAATNELVRLQSVTRFGVYDNIDVWASHPSGTWIYFAPGEEFLGGLNWTFQGSPKDPSQVPGNGTARAACILRVETVNTAGTDPSQVAVVPRGEPARVELQTSADLREWSALAATNLPPQGTNRFLRVRVSAPAQ